MDKKQRQDNFWTELSEESKQLVLDRYEELNQLKNSARTDEDYDLPCLGMVELENLFGLHNLNPEPPKPKTWEEVEDGYSILADNWNGGAIELNIQVDYFADVVIDKSMAALKIFYLIEQSYGGFISDEEWKNDNKLKYTIQVNADGRIIPTESLGVRCFIAFHTKSQRDEFMSYDSNIDLIKQYYLLRDGITK